MQKLFKKVQKSQYPKTQENTIYQYLSLYASKNAKKQQESSFAKKNDSTCNQRGYDHSPISCIIRDTKKQMKKCGSSHSIVDSHNQQQLYKLNQLTSRPSNSPALKSISNFYPLTQRLTKQLSTNSKILKNNSIHNDSNQNSKTTKTSSKVNNISINLGRPNHSNNVAQSGNPDSINQNINCSNFINKRFVPQKQKSHFDIPEQIIQSKNRSRINTQKFIYNNATNCHKNSSLTSKNSLKQYNSNDNIKQKAILQQTSSTLWEPTQVKNKSSFFKSNISNNKNNSLCSQAKKLNSNHNISAYTSRQYNNGEKVKYKGRMNRCCSIMRQNSLLQLQNQRQPISGDDFDIIKQLGEGKYGKVYLVKDIKTGFILALKAVSKKKIISDNLLDQLIRQIKIQFFLDHPGIIKLYGFFDDSQNFYLLMELGSGGQLYDFFVQKNKRNQIDKDKVQKRQSQKYLPERRKSISKQYSIQQSASFIAKSLLQVINYMHDMKVIHRDLKPQNIVIVMGTLKICDFGWAAHIGSQNQLRSTFCGTPLYFSPELLQGKSYDQKVDLWAIGVMIFEFVTGQSPFNLRKPQDIGRIVTHEVNYPTKANVSQSFKEFIKNILQKQPQKRYGSNQLLNMRFITSYKHLDICAQLCSKNNIDRK